MKAILSAVLSFLLFAAPSIVKAQEYEYTINPTDTNTITLTQYLGAEAVVAIPSVINGRTVTSLGPVFAYDSGLTSVTIPSSVTNIGGNSSDDNGAFSYCDSLANVTLTNGLIRIGDYAFTGCTSLASLTIPDTVEDIDYSAFSTCASLTNLVIPPSVTAIGGQAFSYCTSLDSFTFPSNVTSIADETFVACTNLTNITIANGVTVIGLGAFSDCLQLTNVTIPGSVTRIADQAFILCTNLNGVYFQGNAPTFGVEVFYPDNRATVYRLPGKTGWGSASDYRPVVVWNPLIQTADAGFGVRSDQFGFNIVGAPNLNVVVEARASMASPIWTPLTTLSLTNGSAYFSEPVQTGGASHFYRIRSP